MAIKLMFPEPGAIDRKTTERERREREKERERGRSERERERENHNAMDVRMTIEGGFKKGYLFLVISYYVSHLYYVPSVAQFFLTHSYLSLGR